jgi:C_GCAxxG_C_C family probable redox protein
MTGNRDNDLIKAVTGLEGGCVACGSTCGVLTGGALGIAMGYESDDAESGIMAQKRALQQVGEYVGWFETAYGTSLCRERTRTNFYSVWSQLKYFFTFYRLSGCFRHMYGAMRYLYQNQSIAPITGAQDENPGETLHCAQKVLKGIREKTNIGNRQLENLSFVFDGGVGLTGGLCGALAGAITGINLVLGMPVRNMSYWKTIKGFGVGHVNLLMDRPSGKPEPFKAGKQVMQKFKEIAGSTECRDISGERFTGWDSFQEFIQGSSRCQHLMDFAVDAACEIIRHQG